MTSSTINREITAEGRPLGGTEYSWCKAAAIGTGISVVAFLVPKLLDQRSLESSIRALQKIHPILSCRLLFDSKKTAYSLIPSPPYVSLQVFDVSATAELIHSSTTVSDSFHLLLEHELNRNVWERSSASENTTDMLLASMYAIDECHAAVMLRAHTGVCDRSSMVAILRELVQLSANGVREEEISGERKIESEIEKLIPAAAAKKSIWARGVDVLGYSLNAFRLSSLGFVDTASRRSSRIVRVKFDRDETLGLLGACATNGLDLWAALAAASVVAARATKEIPKEQKEKYGVITLVNCRPILSPALAPNHAGFYHSAIMKTHDVSGKEGIWEVARRIQTSFTAAKKGNKHLTDVGDLNFLMNSAIDKPSLTPGGAMRTSLIGVFEESAVESEGVEGVQDCVGCSSVHGIGPSITVFDTLSKGELDCVCVYPSPLHSKDQMDNVIQDVKRILISGCKTI